MSKKNRAALRRSLLTLSMVLVVAFAAVGGTLAWLTSTATVENTFTVGNVSITLDEAPTTEYGVADEEAARVTANAYKLLPGHTYDKDPIVHVKGGSESCWVFVEVTNGIAAIENDTIDAQIKANGWTPMADHAGVYYKQNIDASEVAEDATLDLKVFETFTIKEGVKVEDLPAYEGSKITIVAYAIQSLDIDTVEEAWTNLGKN